MLNYRLGYNFSINWIRNNYVLNIEGRGSQRHAAIWGRGVHGEETPLLMTAGWEAWLRLWTISCHDRFLFHSDEMLWTFSVSTLLALRCYGGRVSTRGL
jgi:hypothetical protein